MPHLSGILVAHAYIYSYMIMSMRFRTVQNPYTTKWKWGFR